MSEIRAVEAALFAFQKREPGFVLARASATYIVLLMLLGAGYAALIWPSLVPLARWYFGAIQAASQGVEPSAPPLTALISIAPWGVAHTLLSGVLSAAFEATCLRWLVRGEQGGGLMGLRLGGDTWRVFLCYIVWIALALALIAVVVAVFILLRGVGSLGGALSLVAMLLGALAPLGLLFLTVWASVRLAPAAATSVARGRFAFSDAWRVTRGSFWGLFGGFLLVVVGYFVVAMLVGQVLQMPLQQKLQPILMNIAAGGDVETAFANLKVEVLTPFFAVVACVYLVFSTVLSCVFRICMYGINARAAIAALEEGKIKPAAA